jgi:putative ABC transport system permease protein
LQKNILERRADEQSDPAESGNYFDFKVTGIFKPFPANTHFHPDLILSFNTLNDSLIYGARNLSTNFGNNSFFTYIKLPGKYDPKKLEAQLPAFVDKHVETGPKFKASQWTSLRSSETY